MMHIVYVSDGKAGHRSQAQGLFKAMQRQCAEAVTLQEISIEDNEGDGKDNKDDKTSDKKEDSDGEEDNKNNGNDLLS